MLTGQSKNTLTLRATPTETLLTDRVNQPITMHVVCITTTTQMDESATTTVIKQ